VVQVDLPWGCPHIVMAAASRALSAVFKDRGARWVLGGWSIFTVENVILSEYRQEIKRSWGGSAGPKAYQSLYSSLSATCLGSTIIAYWTFARHSTVLRSTPADPKRRVVAFAARALGLATLGQLMPPVNLQAAPLALGMTKAPETSTPIERGALGCPFDMNAYKDRGEVFGITRITRRPELFGLGAIAAGGAILATTAAEMAFFGVGPAVCFTVLALHSDRTQVISEELSESKIAQTSVMPFLALVSGQQSWADLCSDLVPQNIAAAVLLAGVMALRPPWLRWVK